MITAHRTPANSGKAQALAGLFPGCVARMSAYVEIQPNAHHKHGESPQLTAGRTSRPCCEKFTR